MRPSTLLRIERLTVLVAAFSADDLGVAEIAILLRCSASAARNYVFELTDAGVIVCASGSCADGSVDRTRFGLTADKALVDAFMFVLASPGTVDVTRANVGRDPRAVLRSTTAPEIPPMRNPVPAVAQRDPLVAALFGAARSIPEPRAQAT